MKALTIDALWAWAILAGHKRIENRSWTTPFRGRLAIHAGKSSCRDGDAYRLFDRLEITPPDAELLQDLRGRLLGTVELFDVLAYDSQATGPAAELAHDPFATGPWCWKLRHPVWLQEPIPIVGNLRLWDWPAGDEPLIYGSPPEGTAPPCRQSTRSSNLFST